ncbi:MAG TPA: hypothetical protein VFV41_14475 [Streptosporangiaceae bacterium]|nr:hypothetical protein [Streptosporangiaceae bacterium]
MTTPTMAWTRLARRLGVDHNPLRRRSDLIEAWLLPVAIALFLILGPVAVAGATWFAHAQSAADRQVEQTWHRVPAMLLRAAPGPVAGGSSHSWTVREPARWVTADGLTRTAQVPVMAGTRAGSVVPVWLDRAGQPQSPPLTAGQVADRVVVAVSAALAGLAVLLTGLVLVIRWQLNRRRLASWAADWDVTGPRWSHQDHQD